MALRPRVTPSCPRRAAQDLVRLSASTSAPAGETHTPICTKIRKCVANEKGGQARVGEGSCLGSPNQISRTGQARQRIRRDKGNVRKRSKTTAVFTAR